MSTNVSYQPTHCDVLVMNFLVHVFPHDIVSTKAELRFHLESADWIPDRVKLKMKERVILTSIISCHTRAYQEEGVELALPLSKHCIQNN